eukprot:4226817-Alexandrium_andersonii.AAC.1
MSASLVGSEMCIRDRCPTAPLGAAKRLSALLGAARRRSAPLGAARRRSCLLYTSDAADDM